MKTIAVQSSRYYDLILQLVERHMSRNLCSHQVLWKSGSVRIHAHNVNTSLRKELVQAGCVRSGGFFEFAILVVFFKETAGCAQVQIVLGPRFPTLFCASINMAVEYVGSRSEQESCVLVRPLKELEEAS